MQKFGTLQQHLLWFWIAAVTRKEEKKRQAGAELCQAQFKLGLAKPAILVSFLNIYGSPSYSQLC